MVQQSEFEKLIENNESALRRIRNTYFPLIAQRIITGYNLYPKLFDYSQGRFFLNYFHSDLKPDDAHFKGLSKILKDEGFLEERTIIGAKAISREGIVQRDADYLTRPGWKDPENMRYFDFRGNEISAEEAKSLEEDLVGEVLQYDWLIRLNDEEELRQVIDIFKKYTSKFQLDKHGRVVMMNRDPQYNEESISEAWEIPLLICTTTCNKKPRSLLDFLRVNQFNIPERLGRVPIVLSTLVGAKTRELKRFLQEQGHNINPVKKYALRVFVEDYIDR